MEKVSELGERARGWYAALRTRLETPENIGKLVSIDVETGGDAIGDDDSLTAPHSLREKNPAA